MIETRACGILLHPTSLPSPYGIGGLGQEAFDFIDFLHEAGQTYWQILPLEPIDASNSPYASCSAFAKNIYLISPEQLVKDGLLIQEDIDNHPYFTPDQVQYERVKAYKDDLFKKAFDTFNQLSKEALTEFNAFCSNQSFWLDDYALYIAIKEHYQAMRQTTKKDYQTVFQRLKNTFQEDTISKLYKGGAWITWPLPLKDRHTKALNKIQADLRDQIHYHKFIQFIFFNQWERIKTYANSKAIKIIGDIPIFVSYDSADVWSEPELFDIDQGGLPKEVAGVPPDYFSEDGQLWGNPLYDWRAHEKTNFKWWVMRLKNILQYVDLARIDHFRGLEAYWAIPIEAKTAKEGQWRKGPGHKFFDAFIRELGSLPIIAEDLGTLTDEVHMLRDRFDLAGMAILQFAFQNDKHNPYLPHNCSVNTVLYTGTHDNDTLASWYSKAHEGVKDHVRSYINNNDDDIVWKLIRLAYASVCHTVIIPMQDIQQLGTGHRMNVPGVAKGNWEWRYRSDMVTPAMSDGLNYLRELYAR